MQVRTLLGCCVAALIGMSLVLLPTLPLASISIRRTVEVNEVTYAGGGVSRSVPWYHLPLIVVVGLFFGLGAYFGVKSYLKRAG